MNTRILGPSRFTAAACATLITVFSAWAFVNSTASSERDPFQRASITAANAKTHVAQLQSRIASTCRNKARTLDRPAVCLGG